MDKGLGIKTLVLGVVSAVLTSVAVAADRDTQRLVFGYSPDGSPVSHWDKGQLGFCGHVYDYLDNNQKTSGYTLEEREIWRKDQRFAAFAQGLQGQPGVQCGPNSSTESRRKGLKPEDGTFDGEFSQIFFSSSAKVMIRTEKIPALYAGEPIGIGILDSKVLGTEKDGQINCNRSLDQKETSVTTTSVASLFPHARMLAVASRKEAVACLKKPAGMGLDAYAGDGIVLEDIRLKNLAGYDYSIEPPLGSFLREDYVLAVYNAPGLAAHLDQWLKGEAGVQARAELESQRDGNFLTQSLSDLLVWANRSDHLPQFFTGLLLVTLLLAGLGALGVWLLLRRRGGWLAGQGGNSLFSPLEQDERRHFSRELHDNVLQMLAAARRRIELAQKQIARQDGAYEDNLNVSMATLGETIDEVRRISHEMRNEMEDALDALLRDFEERNGIKVTKICSARLQDLPERTSLMLYRVTQEALMNIERHAQASEVEVRLNKNAKQVRMEIRDNGKGFNPDQLPPQKGIGLNNMAERVELLGGKLRIDSAPGRGALVWATVPLA